MTLVILCGPTGVGRSTIIHTGQKRYKWRPVPWYTTRSGRREDTDRICVSDDTFGEMRSANQFHYEFSFFGFCYGVRRRDIEKAIDSQGVWLTDLLPSSLAEFPDARALRVGVIAESDQALADRLACAGRGERAASAIAEQHRLEARSRGLSIEHVVVNQTGDVSGAVDGIARLIQGC